jgi:hypothetical protein
MVRTLERLRQVLGEFAQRLVTTTELDVVRELGIARNLIRAIRANTGALPLFEFAGATQQDYEPVAVLDLQGIGFEAWVTPAGFAGVTAYVADLRTGRILTKTNALPQDVAGDIAMRGFGAVGWADQLAAQPAFGGSSTSVLELARGRFLLSGAMVAPDSGRLSGSSKTQVAKRPPLLVDDPKLRALRIEGAGDALRIARRLGFDALGRPPSSPPVALLPTRGLLESRFSSAEQRLYFGIVLASGIQLGSSLGYREDRTLWLDNVEKLAKKTSSAPSALLVRLRLDDAGLSLEPLTAHFTGRAPQHLTFRTLENA